MTDDQEQDQQDPQQDQHDPAADDQTRLELERTRIALKAANKESAERRKRLEQLEAEETARQTGRDDRDGPAQGRDRAG